MAFKAGVSLPDNLPFPFSVGPEPFVGEGVIVAGRPDIGTDVVFWCFRMCAGNRGKQQDGAHADALHHQLALVLARHNAIEIGEVLTPVQMETLIGDLFQCDNPNLSPSGKTIITILQQEQIDKMFN